MSMRVAVTGNPDVGKSTIIRIIECELPNAVLAGGDALHAIAKKFFPEAKTEFSRRRYQKALYHLQNEYEESLSHDHPKKLLLCDHGSLDLLALWPGSVDEFFKELNTTLEKELSRYEYVIHINGFETPKTSRLKLARHEPKLYWQNHPRFLEIPAQKGFSFSYMETTKIVNGVIGRLPFEEIKSHLLKSTEKPAQSGFLNLGIKERLENANQ